MAAVADVFLSYKREDRPRAEAVVAALREAGCSVWWDEGLTPRRAWDATIEQEIAAAKSVVVLWSPRSIASDWVRTEAHYAQDHAKLVPVLIEPCTIPLAFILKQAVDLSHWRGARDDPAWLKLLDWVSAQEPARAPHVKAPERRPQRFKVRTLALAAAVAVSLVAALALVIMAPRLGAPPGPATLRVPAFVTRSGDQAATAFSQGFAADLAQIVSAGGSKLKVLDGVQGAASPADFTLAGSVRSDATDVHATITLNSAADGAIIWTTNVSRPLAQADAMHHEAAVRMGAVFVCALDEATRHRDVLGLDALKVYLQACEALPSGDDLHTRKLLRDLVALAPRFAQGWALLAEWNGFIVQSQDDDAAAAAKEGLDAAARALSLDPRTAAAWTARAMMKTKMSDWVAAQADLMKAFSLDPDDPIGNYFYASNLINIGRNIEAYDYALRSANSGPMFWPKNLQVIQTLANTGDTEGAQDALAKARATWPDRDNLKDAAVVLAVRYADPSKAADVLDDPVIKAIESPAQLQLLRLEAAARADPSPAKVEAAAQSIDKVFAGPDDAPGRALNSMVIGRTDAAYDALAKAPIPLPNVFVSTSPSFLFRPFAAKFRADPRFMPLAQRLGLVAVWKATKWPDFCRARDAPYDCRAVAERLSRAG